MGHGGFNCPSVLGLRVLDQGKTPLIARGSPGAPDVVPLGVSDICVGMLLGFEGNAYIDILMSEGTA